MAFHGIFIKRKMMIDINTNLRDAIKAFDIKGMLVDVKSNKQGHINSTFISTFEDGGKIKKYTHQRINKNVFKAPKEVMSNIVKVTDYIRSSLSKDIDEDIKERLVLKVINTLDNTPYYIDRDGEYWRTYKYIDKAKAYDKCTSPRLAYNLGSAIGNFQLELSDLDGSLLYTTINDFHNMVMRYDNLEKACNDNPVGRMEKVKDELDFLRKNRMRGEMIWRSYKSGELPCRVTHNDTKINNVLFDEDDDSALAVIDLDTIMPGTILFDVGDMIRTSCNTAEEDEKDLGKVDFDLDMYRGLIDGYYSKANSFMTEKEKQGVLESGRMMIQIMAVRFITDYIEGDRYYRVDYPEHNLSRARNQIKLIKSLDEKWNEARTITDRIIEGKAI